MLSRSSVTFAAVAVTHVTLVDGAGAEPKLDQTVVMVGDRIAAMGSSATVKAPAAQ